MEFDLNFLNLYFKYISRAYTFNTNTTQIIAQNRTRRNMGHSFYEAPITLILKPHKDSTKRKKKIAVNFSL